MTMSQFVSSPEALRRCVQSLEGDLVIGMDTEFMRVNTYFPELCLIQISGARDAFCIDALALDDFEPLVALFARADKTLVVHACRQDLEALALRMSVKITDLFDTQIAAAFCNYGAQVGYAELVKNLCQVTLAKTFTRTDWRKRPLAPGQLAYALDDVKYLLPLHAKLHESLQRAGRVEWLAEECRQVAADDSYLGDAPVARAWKNLRGAAKLPPAAQPCAKALAEWRERTAMRYNRPREWILPTAALLRISRRRPTRAAELASIETLPRGIARKSGRKILEIVAANADAKPESPIWPLRAAPTAIERAQIKSLMQKLAEIARTHEFDQSLAATRDDIKHLVLGERDLPLLQGWRRQLVGEALLREMV